MVGGSIRIPKIQKLIRNFFNGKEVNRGINPDEAVAYGVAVQGGIISGDKNAPLIFLMDITPFSLGVAGSGGKMVKIIDKNMVIPIKKSIVMRLPSDSASSVKLHIYQGESAIYMDNIFLGELTLNGIAPAAREIEIICFIDSDGLITVTAVDKKSGSKSSMMIPDAGTLSQEQMDEMIAVIKGFEEEDEMIIKRVQAKNILESTAYKVKNQLDDENELINLSVEDREILYEAVNDMINWLDHNPNANVYEYREKHQKLEDYIKKQDNYNIEKHLKNNINVDEEEEEVSNMYMNALWGLCTVVAIICGWYVITQLRNENKALKTRLLDYERSNRKLDESQFKQWDAKNIVLWISQLENGLFGQYKTKLLESLIDDGIEGNDLEDINNHNDWKEYGNIHKFGDRKKLIQYVGNLIGQEGIANANKVTANLYNTQHIDR
eukprot:308978_1